MYLQTVVCISRVSVVVAKPESIHPSPVAGIQILVWEILHHAIPKTYTKLILYSPPRACHSELTSLIQIHDPSDGLIDRYVTKMGPRKIELIFGCK